LEAEEPPLAGPCGTRSRPATNTPFATATSGKLTNGIIPEEQHQACDKEEAQTNHVERFNLTSRQRIGRLTWKTLSFSKSYFMHIVVRLILTHYKQIEAMEL
jgi:hypothetical protein